MFFWEGSGVEIGLGGVFVQEPVVDFYGFFSFCGPGVHAQGVGVGLLAEGGSTGGVVGEGFHFLGEVLDEVLFVAEWDFDAVGGGDETTGAAVVDDDAGEAGGHGFDDDTRAEFADAGEGEDVGFAHELADFGLGAAADEVDAMLEMVVVDELLEVGHFGAVTGDDEFVFLQVGVGGHGGDGDIGAFVGDEAAGVEEGDLGFDGAVGGGAEEGGVDADFWEVDHAVAIFRGEAIDGVLEGGEDGGGLGVG